MNAAILPDTPLSARPRCFAEPKLGGTRRPVMTKADIKNIKACILHNQEVEAREALARSSGRRMRRGQADALLDKVLRRVERVNSAERIITLDGDRFRLAHLFVDNVRVFGSYLGTEPMIGDLDIAISCSLRSSGKPVTEKMFEKLGISHSLECDDICEYVKDVSPRRIDLAATETILEHGFPNRLIYTRQDGRTYGI
jgi:hypothetical protein